jgi:3'-phosphoadenosine 5'-phosphosulfate sulfotransferase (PAPS reductase)/FAD synthetase
MATPRIQQLSFFPSSLDDAVATTPDLQEALRSDPVVAINTSGGKDSAALAYRVMRYLDEIGHRGERLLVHADLGEVEWEASLPTCQRTAERLGIELLVVKKPGGLMARWNSRWEAIVQRYSAMERAKVTMPWSSAAFRYCTGELKQIPIASALAKRFPGRVMISALGLRAQESAARAAKPIAAIDPKFSVAGRTYWTWNPILRWDLQTVWDEIERAGDVPHHAYTEFGSTRVSCSFCVLASLNDLKAAARCESNAAAYRAMVDLEIRSTFSFQAGRWLADIAPSLLTEAERSAAREAKEQAAVRAAAEARYPADLLLSAGRCERMPTSAEARDIAAIRRVVGQALAVDLDHLGEEAVMRRYAELTGTDLRIAA